MIEMNMSKTLLLAVVLLLIGKLIRARVSFLRKYCIPDAVVGGLLFATLTFILYQADIVTFKFDGTLQTFFMNIFFTASGFEAGASLIKKSGGKLGIFIVLAALLAFLQNVLAVGLSGLVGVDPLIGLMTGSIPMTGGHGNAAAFAPLAEDMGVTGAVTVAVAAATFGLVAGSMVGGPTANRLITKHNLMAKRKVQTTNGEIEVLEEETEEMPLLSGTRISKAAFLVFIALGLGAYLADLFKVLLPNVTLPIHVMGMIGGAIVRNVYDKIMKDENSTPLPEISIIGDITLGLFVTMAVMTMKLWELTSLAIPLIILLFAQVLLIYIFVNLLTYTLMGKDYDAAVMTAGHIGFGMGAVPVSMANMKAVCEKYEYSKMAFIIVPVVGGMFSNFTNAAIITGFLNYLG